MITNSTETPHAISDLYYFESTDVQNFHWFGKLVIKKIPGNKKYRLQITLWKFCANYPPRQEALKVEQCDADLTLPRDEGGR